MSTTYGPKIRDGLRAYREQAEHRGDDSQPAGYWFADAILMRMGYPEKVADSIIDRLGRADLIEWGVSARTGWLTAKGKAALAGRELVMGESAVSAPDWIPAGLTDDEDFRGHSTDASRSHRRVHPGIAPDSPALMVAAGVKP